MAEDAETGPEIDESMLSSEAPDRTRTGPSTVAPSRQVTPDTVSGPRCLPVTVDVQARTNWSKRARATAKLGAQVNLVWCWALNCGSRASPAAATSAAVTCSLGSIWNTSKPRAISLP